MRSLQNSPRQETPGRRLNAVFAAIAVVYPFLVYTLHERVSFIVFAFGAIVLLLLRAFLVSGGLMALFRLPLLGAAVALVFLSLIDAALAAKTYPALLSLMVAALFGNSLRHAPSLIERIARLRDPDLSVAGQDYCRRLTWIWVVWLTLNAIIAALLAMSASIDLWILWTGVVSYVCSGTLFFGEMILRPWLLAASRPGGRDA